MTRRTLQSRRRSGRSYWHGGPSGIRVNTLIIPAAELSSRPAWYTLGLDYPADSTRVYVTDDLDIARFHAGNLTGMGGSGAVYQVEPLGLLQVDPDFPTCCYSCPRARVARVAEQDVRLTNRISLHIARMTMWDGGGPMYDHAGFLLPSPQMLELGIKEEDLQALGFLPHPSQYEPHVIGLARQRGHQGPFYRD